jgi:ABC-type dipeptide/oligopeptide/nickel transport system permease subunit
LTSKEINTGKVGRRNSLWYYSYIRFKRHKLAFISLIYLILLILLSLFADIISPHNPDRQILEFTSKPSFYSCEVIQKKDLNTLKIIPIKKVLKEENNSIYYIDFLDKEKVEDKSNLLSKNNNYIFKESFILGTDKFGRDLLSRLIYGARISLSVGLISQTIALLIGVALGSISGYFRGGVDKIIMWLINVVWAFPSILLVISISVVLGKGYWQAFVAIGLTSWVEIARIVRGQFITLKEAEYVESARALGFGHLRIIFRQILPNAMSPVIVTSTVGLANAIIFEASLSFLGLGVQPPTASWGQMIFDGYKYLITGTNFGMVLYPAIAIMLIVFAVNLIGDGLRDSLDPKLKK